jgi:putative membrane protein
MKRTLAAIWTLGLLGVAATAAHAQAQPVAAQGYRPDTLLGQVVSTLVFSGLGILLAIVGFKLFDAVIPFSLEREICEKNNVAVAILAGAMVLGICFIVAYVVGSS